MKYNFPIALITLPKIKMLPVSGTGFDNLNGYWIPPAFVLEFWSAGCYIPYINEQNTKQKRELIHESYLKCISQFYADNAF